MTKPLGHLCVQSDCLHSCRHVSLSIILQLNAGDDQGSNFRPIREVVHTWSIWAVFSEKGLAAVRHDSERRQGKSRTTMEPQGIFGHVKEAIDAKADAVLESTLEKALDRIGDSGRDTLIRAYAPTRFSNMLLAAWEHSWNEIADELKETAMTTLGNAEGKKLYRAHRIAGWAGPLSLWPGSGRCPRPLSYLRAKLLYLHAPADSNFFEKVWEPFFWIILLLKLDPAGLTPGSSVLIQLLVFFCIDKRDEYQLSSYILQFKGFQFVSATISITLVGARAFLLYLAASRTQHGASLGGVLTESDFWSGLVADAPGQDLGFTFEISLLPVRLLLLYTCTLLLACGYAYGGGEEIRLLEQVRLDAADGNPDGNVDHAALKAFTKDGDARAPRDDGPMYVRRYNNAVWAAREKLGPARPRRTAGLLPSFMLYDLVVVVLLASGSVALVLAEGWSWDDWILWTTFYYISLAYGILSGPFVIFTVPVLGQALHHAKPTGYDKSGMLVPVMSNGALKRRIQKEKEGHERRQSLEARLEGQDSAAPRVCAATAAGGRGLRATAPATVRASATLWRPRWPFGKAEPAKGYNQLDEMDLWSA